MSEIQFNDKIRFIAGMSKDELKKKSNDKDARRSDNWQIRNIDHVSLLASMIAEGITVRAGIIRKKSNSAQDIEVVNWVFLDFDNSPVKDTLEADYTKKYACLWYYTPSYEAGVNEKHRLVFHLDKGVTTDEADYIYRKLWDYYDTPDKGCRVHNDIFGAKSPDSVMIISESNKIPVDILLTGYVKNDNAYENQSHEVSKNTDIIKQDNLEPKLSEPDKIGNQVLKWIASEVWTKACEQDIDAFYCLDEHNFERQPDDKRHLGRWGGHRPNDDSKTTGTGFFIYWLNDEYPPAFQNQSPDDHIEKGNFVEYWWYYNNLNHNKGWGSIDGRIDRDYANYQLVVDDIADCFEVPRFDFKAALDTRKAFKDSKKSEKQKEKEQKAENFIQLVNECLKQFVRKLSNGAKDSFFYWDFKKGIWRLKSTTESIYPDCVKYWLKNFKGVAESDLCDLDTIKFIKSMISNYEEYASFEDKIYFDMARNTDIVPMANGDWNWKDKIFTEYFNPDNFSQTRSGLDFREHNGTGEGIEFFNYWLNEMDYTSEEKKMIKAWLIVNSLGLAVKTKRMLCIYGTPETGKTVLGQIIQNVLGHSLCVTARGEQLIDPNNRFAMQALDNKFGVFLDEFRADYKGWEVIKRLVGNGELKIEVEKKFMGAYNILFLAGLTTATQDKFTIPNADDGGIRRRIVLLKHRKEMHKTHLQDVDLTFARKDIFADIFNWAIQQDGEQAIQDFIAYAKSQEHKIRIKEMLIGSDQVLTFIKDCLVFTDDESDYLTNNKIQEVYSAWLESEMAENSQSETNKNKIKRIVQYIREKAAIPDNDIKWELLPEKSKDPKIKIDGKWVRGLKGIRLKTVEEAEIDTEYIEQTLDKIP